MGTYTAAAIEADILAFEGVVVRLKNPKQMFNSLYSPMFDRPLTERDDANVEDLQKRVDAFVRAAGR